MEGETAQEGKGGCGDEIRRGRDDSPKDGGSFGNVMAVYPLERYFSHGALDSRSSCVRLHVDLGIVCRIIMGAREHLRRQYKTFQSRIPDSFCGSFTSAISYLKLFEHADAELSSALLSSPLLLPAPLSSHPPSAFPLPRPPAPFTLLSSPPPLPQTQS